MEDYRENDKNNGYFSKKLRAGKRRTYFFDVRATRGNDYYLTITESKRKPNGSGYESHKVFLYKEDFKKFVEGLEETIHHIKTELMPDFDFENFTRETYFENQESEEGSHYNHHENTTNNDEVEVDSMESNIKQNADSFNDNHNSGDIESAEEW